MGARGGVTRGSWCHSRGRGAPDKALQNASKRVVVATQATEATLQIAVTSRQQLAGMHQTSLAGANSLSQ